MRDASPSACLNVFKNSEVLRRALQRNNTTSSGFGDSTQIIDKFLLGHTNTSIGDGKSLVFLVCFNLGIDKRACGRYRRDVTESTEGYLL